jgi:uncharacterized membrane protein
MPELKNYSRYIQIGALVLLFAGAGWFALYGSTFTHVIAGFVIAVILYVFRKYHRVLYGLCEVIVGIVALVQTYPLVRQTCGTFAESCEPFKWYVIPLATFIAIYILIRGFDNIEQGYSSSPR